ncbi:MAG: ribosome maturation factor RimM [bacterium]
MRRRRAVRNSGEQKVAELGRPHGIRGEITALLFGVTGAELSAMTTLRVRRPNGAEAPLRIEDARPKGQGWILRIDGVEDREGAEELRGAAIVAPREDLPEAQPGEWWIDDLVGLEVVSDDGEAIGRLVDVWTLPANDVYVVRSADGEVLLPAIEDVIVGVDLEKKTMTVHLLPGLIDGANGS